METLFEHAGGEPAIRRFIDRFYSQVLADPLLQPLFGKGKPDHVDHLTAFEAETFGGLPRFTGELGGFERMIAVHRHLNISETQRERFIALYMRAADEARLPIDLRFRQALRAHVEFGTQVALQNSHAKTDAELHPLREVPKWTWTSDEEASAHPNDVPSFLGHDGGGWEPVASQVVASWPRGSFAENLAVDAKGNVYVSLHSHNCIERFCPRNGCCGTFAALPAPVAGLAFAEDGTLWATGGKVFEKPGCVWRIDPSGSVEEWLKIPDAVFLNGCTWLPDGRTLLICESSSGQILAVDRLERRWTSWIADDRLRPVNQQMPGANGIKYHAGRVFVSNTDLNEILSIVVRQDGSAGEIRLAAKNLRADDFAFSVSGTLYVTTHPAHSVMRLLPNGSRDTIAGPDKGAVGSTSCAFGRADRDITALYVTTSGGLWTPYKGEIQEAKLLRLEVGETGELL